MWSNLLKQMPLFILYFGLVTIIGFSKSLAANQAKSATIATIATIATTATTVQSFLNLLYDQSHSKKSVEKSFEESLKLQDLTRPGYQSTIAVKPYLTERTFLSQNFGSLTGNQNGVQLSLEQQTPWGLSLQVDTDLINQMSLPNSTRLDSSLAWGVSLQLWQNSFGQIDRKERESFDLKILEQKIRNEQELKLACRTSGELAMRYYLGLEALKQSQEVESQAQQLSKLVEQGQRQGLISRLDALSLESEIIRAQQEHLRARTDLESIEQDLKSESYGKSPFAAATSKERVAVQTVPWANEFESILNRLSSDFIQIENAKTNQDPIETYELTLKKIELKRMEIDVAKAASALEPTLDLALKNAEISGESAGQNFEQDDQTIELSFSMKLNNSNERARVFEARSQRILVQSKVEQLQAVQAEQLQLVKRSLKDQKNRLDLSKQQKSLQEKIYQESVRRYQQGRLEFQELLRQRQNFNSARQTYLRELSTLWGLVFASHSSWTSGQNICERIGSNL